MRATVSRGVLPGDIVLVLDAEAAVALSTMLDDIDVTDIALNPGYHGYSNDTASSIAAVVSAIRAPLDKAVSYLP